MKTKFAIIGLLVVGAWGCSSNNDDDPITPSPDNTETTSHYTVATVDKDPAWQVNWESNDARPDWQEPNPSNYQNWAVMILKVEDELMPFVSDDDLMAIFVDDELRGLSHPAISLGGNVDEDRGTFVLKAYGDEANQMLMTVTVCYYCSQLRQLFSRTVMMTFDIDRVYGLEEDIVMLFTRGSSKYPVVSELGLSSFSTQLSELKEVAAGDVLAAFVGDECRGICTLDDLLLSEPALMTIFRRNAEETITLKCYRPSTSQLFTFTSPISIPDIE